VDCQKKDFKYHKRICASPIKDTDNDFVKIKKYIILNKKKECVDVTNKNILKYIIQTPDPKKVYVYKKTNKNASLFREVAISTHNPVNTNYIIVTELCVSAFYKFNTLRIDQMITCDEKINENDGNVSLFINYITKKYKIDCIDITDRIDLYHVSKFVDKANENHNISYIFKRTIMNNIVFEQFEKSANSKKGGKYIILYKDDYLITEKFKPYHIDNIFIAENNICNICFEQSTYKRLCECGYQICRNCLYNMAAHKLHTCPQCKNPIMKSIDDM
jgi:hypothetical protein